MKFLDLGLYQGIFAEVMAKGKKLPVGTIREWKGNKYIKTPTGDWKPHTTGNKENQTENDTKDMAELKKIYASAKADFEAQVKDKEDKLKDILKNQTEKELRSDIDHHGKQYNNAKRIREMWERDGLYKEDPKNIYKNAFNEYKHKFLGDKTKEEAARRKEESARIKAALPPVTDEMIDKIESEIEDIDYYKSVTTAKMKEKIKDNLKNGTLKLEKQGKRKPTYTINGEKVGYSTYDYAKALQEGLKKEQNNLSKQNMNIIYSCHISSKKIEELKNLIQEATNPEKIKNNDFTGKVLLRETTKEEVDEVLKQGGPDITGLNHEITAEEIHHAIKQHGQSDESIKHPGQRQITKDDITLIPDILNEPTQITVQPRGTNRTSIIYSKDFGNGSMYYVERVLETSKRNEPRLTMRTIWATDTAIGVKSNPTTVYTPYRTSNITHSVKKSSEKTINKAQNGKKMILVMKKRRVNLSDLD